MHIALTGLEKGPQKYRHRGPASQYVGEAAEFPGEITVWAVAEKENPGLIRVDLTVEVPGEFACDRCGREFQQTHRAQEDFYFAYEGKASARAGGDEDFGIIPKGATELDLSQEIRDLVMLNLPSPLLCREDCRGLCPVCGADLNLEEEHHHEVEVDPRWQGLDKLKDSDQE
ncbi:MAG: DUF177 domain-containing protein [Candidatus Zixiibacteriota bacterium]|nr:MAG: DUF177 domain-containing protein [candidate division Zixibacteria bacterium]